MRKCQHSSRSASRRKASKGGKPWTRHQRKRKEAQRRLLKRGHNPDKYKTHRYELSKLLSEFKNIWDRYPGYIRTARNQIKLTYSHIHPVQWYLSHAGPTARQLAVKKIPNILQKETLELDNTKWGRAIVFAPKYTVPWDPSSATAKLISWQWGIHSRCQGWTSVSTSFWNQNVLQIICSFWLSLNLNWGTQRIKNGVLG